MKTLRVGLVVGLALLAAGIASADGLDPTLSMGGGHGSPNCFGPGGVSFQGSTGATGTFSASCNNNGPVDLTSFSFDILAADAPGGITPTLNGLLAPFAGVPLLSSLDWTASCVQSGSVDICTAKQSSLVSGVESSLCSTDFATTCSELDSLSAAQMEAADPGAFKTFNNDPCEDPIVYIVFGIIPGCDATVGTVPNGGSFVEDALFDIAPPGSTPASLPEPSSLALLLVGLSGLPFLRRRLAR